MANSPPPLNLYIQPHRKSANRLNFDISEGAKVWDGMMGLLFEDKVDAAVGTIFYLQEILNLQKN